MSTAYHIVITDEGQPSRVETADSLEILKAKLATLVSAREAGVRRQLFVFSGHRWRLTTGEEPLLVPPRTENGKTNYVRFLPGPKLQPSEDGFVGEAVPQQADDEYSQVTKAARADRQHPEPDEDEKDSPFDVPDGDAT